MFAESQTRPGLLSHFEVVGLGRNGGGGFGGDLSRLPGLLPHFEVVGLGWNGGGGFGGDLSRFCTRRLDSRF